MMFECINKVYPSVSIDTVTGAICSFSDNIGGLPLKSHKIALTATQSGSGTPSPSNPRPISGYSDISVSATGKNIGNKDLFVRGTIKGDGTDGESSWRLRSPFIPVKPDNSYSFMCNSEVNIYEIHKYGANGEYYGYNPINATSTIYTFPSNVYYTKVLIRYSNNAVIDITDLTQFQIAESETALPYEPFGTYTTITIGSTVYGGEYDARTGVLTVTHGFVDLGTLNWGYSSSVFNSSVIPTLNAPTNKIICSSYETTPYNVSSANMPDKSIKCYGGSENKIIYIKDSDYTEPAVFKTAMSGVQLVYELATPTTIQLPPCPIDTLEGVNNIWADTGNTTVEYIKIV